MKKLTKIAAGLALATAATVSTSAFAEVSYNVGYASEYYYRGIIQKASSASAGIDYEESGFYVGAWTADVGAGLEYDIYGGFGYDFTDDISGSIGYTGYFYTDDTFDDTYQEVNLGLSFAFVGLEYSFGEYDNYGAEQDYDFFAITLEQAGFYGTYGTFGDDFDGDYFEVGYGTTIADVDMGIAAIFNDSLLSDQTDSVTGNPISGEALVFTLGYSF
ncbi:MAG: hypothetical protein CMP91_07145 [Gammaproteobacteria bacterium]|nr:hypothetical protein [Gammaproteobacteria bacterium]MAY02253.1 hypothetical protein [Gammaproteobacteria bacterium]|tara:strand:+ start:157 stop:807 length:651 start_codon:yes stop_codon:yes gene_type:complete